MYCVMRHAQACHLSFRLGVSIDNLFLALSYLQHSTALLSHYRFTSLSFSYRTNHKVQDAAVSVVSITSCKVNFANLTWQKRRAHSQKMSAKRLEKFSIHPWVQKTLFLSSQFPRAQWICSTVQQYQYALNMAECYSMIACRKPIPATMTVHI